uniref:kelch domain-containing protein 4-like n=1 Tax=Styela clava TaxID=7725 RepID=UPI00193A3AA5|nr:kelch domain-containing protein 4-like [Styela clava]
MVKKKNKKEKGRGAEKAAQKLAKKSKKDEGVEDLEALIAEFKVIDKKKHEVFEEKSSPPSPRINLSVTVHPEKDEILLFGGEYDTGNKTYVYNDLYLYNIKKNEWNHLFVPNPPPPRCAHQAVAVSKDGGQLWIFGGEFASPTHSKFYHYKDLWILHLLNKRWEQIDKPGGPSPRSGHRMVNFKKQLIVFGGFHESSRDFAYFNDCYSFDLTEYQWSKIIPTGRGPSPRSGCHLLSSSNGIVIIGGYSKVKIKKDIDKGTPHDDMFFLEPDTIGGKDTSAILKWKWGKVKESGSKPSPRSAFGMATIGGNRVVMFGGVFDEDEEDDISSIFYNSMYCLDLTSFRWFPFDLRKTKQKSKTKKSKNVEESEKMNEDENEEEPMETDETEIELKENEDDSEKKKNIVWIPCGRMNPVLVTKHGFMYLYGGAYEEDEKQVTLNDMWCINLKTLTTWKQLYEADDTSGDWHESDSQSSSEDESEKADEAVGGTYDNQGTKETKSDIKKTVRHPKPEEQEGKDEYWLRTSEYWLELMCDEADEDIPADKIKMAAEEMAAAWFDKKMKKKLKKMDE